MGETDTPFSFRRVGTTGHEIRDPDGNVVAWAADEPWAALTAFLLNQVEAEGLGGMLGIADEGDSLCERRDEYELDSEATKREGRIHGVT
jgi:hypothetical protein